MWKSPAWALGVLVLVAAGALVGGGSQAVGSPVAAQPPVIKVGAVGNRPVPITWAQAQATFPTRARVPGWLPPGVAHRSLYYDGHGALDAYWMGPQYQWTLDVTEYPGTAYYLNVVAPNQTPGTIGGIPAMIATWYATPGGAYLTNIAFPLDGNTYDVNGINLSLAIAEHVAESLIHP